MNYDNINELNILMHDFLYDTNTQENHVYEKTNINDITLNDIVKNDNFDCSVILNNAFGHKMNFKVIDAIDSKLILKKYFQNYPLTVIIQKHKEELKNTKNIIDIYYGLFLIQIIMEYRLLNNIPFYLLNICNFNVSNEDLTKDYLDVVNTTFDEDKNAKYCFSIFEHYNSYETIEKFLSIEQSEENIKLLLFQILFSYALLLYKLNNFRHNNFTIHSFLIEKLNEKQNISLSIGDFNMKINTNFIVKLFDFRKSQIADYSNNIDCINDNPTFDIYTLFTSLYTLKNINHDKITKILENFIDIEHIIEKYTNEQLFTKQLITLNPINILTKNNFFNVFMDRTDNLMSLSLGGFINGKDDEVKNIVKKVKKNVKNNESDEDEKTESNESDEDEKTESNESDEDEKTESNESDEDDEKTESNESDEDDEKTGSNENDEDEENETESDVDSDDEDTNTGGSIDANNIPTEKLNEASKLKIEKLRNTIRDLKLKIGGKKNQKSKKSKDNDSLSSLSSTVSDDEKVHSSVQQMPQQNVFGNYRPPQMALTERQMREQEYANQMMQQPMQMMQQPMPMMPQQQMQIMQPMPMMPQQQMQMMQQPMMMEQPMMDQYLQGGGKAKPKKQKMPVVKDKGLFFLNR